MCNKLKGCGRRIDPCMKNIIHYLNVRGIKTLSCCCGHGRYNPTIVVEHTNGEPFEIYSYKFIPRKKRYYIQDKYGHYYIPEAINGR